MPKMKLVHVFAFFQGVKQESGQVQNAVVQRNVVVYFDSKQTVLFSQFDTPHAMGMHDLRFSKPV